MDALSHGILFPESIFPDKKYMKEIIENNPVM